MDRVTLFRDMIVMAASDGSLTESEIGMLSAKAKAWGIDDAAFASAIRYALSRDCRLTLPKSHPDRVELLKELLKMMAADGTLAETEKRIFATAAVAMRFSQEQIDQLIDDTLRELGQTGA